MLSKWLSLKFPTCQDYSTLPHCMYILVALLVFLLGEETLGWDVGKATPILFVGNFLTLRVLQIYSKSVICVFFSAGVWFQRVTQSSMFVFKRTHHKTWLKCRSGSYLAGLDDDLYLPDLALLSWIMAWNLFVVYTFWSSLFVTNFYAIYTLLFTDYASSKAPN